MNKVYLGLILVVMLFSACGNSESKKQFDISEYLPSEDSSKSYFQVVHDKNGNEHSQTYLEVVKLDANTISIKIENKLNRTFEIQVDNIIKKEYDGNTTRTISMNRKLSFDSTFYTIKNTIKDEPIRINDVVVGTKSIESEEVCKLNSEIDILKMADFFTYKGDILKFECLKKESVDTKIKDEWEGQLQGYSSGSIDLDYDLSYFYLKKGIGLIVEDDTNCHVLKDGINQINDNSKECKEKTFSYNMFLP